MSDVTLRPVRLLRVPLDVHRRNSEHGETLRRELALVEHASHPDAVPARVQRLARSLAERYGAFTAAQDEQLAEALAAGASTVDLEYELPVEVADACDELEALLDELDVYCREGNLLTLVTPPEGQAYRRWFLTEVREQLRDGRPPRTWSPPADVVGAPAAGPAPSDGDDDVASPGPTATITVSEDLDLSLAPRLREEIVSRTEGGVTRVVVDVSHCSFMDSTGLSLLLTTQARLAADGGSLHVIGAKGQVAQVMEISGVTGLLVAGTGGS